MNTNRREFLGSAAALGCAALAPTAGSLYAASSERKLSFFVVGDTHYLANRAAPEKIDAASAEICGRLVDTLNALPGQEIPAEAGGGTVARPAGLIHAGDIIDTGDKQGGVTAQMQKTEWSAFADDYGLTGSDARLKYPVYEVFGNHDAPHGKGVVLDKMVERNKHRPGVVNVSPNGLHYSWDWQDVHFINLGLIVGNDANAGRKRRYGALDSLAFLQSDLRERVKDKRQPLVITHHVDIARYTSPCDDDPAASSKEWDPCDVQAFHAALEGYHVAAIFYGHTHARSVFRWDGQSAKAREGLHVFNTDNASHFHGDAQAFFYVELNDKQLTVREYFTKDRWQTGAFTPQVWTAPLAS